ncbi:hypothetical protein PSTT_12830 [Puccinia striiformis]|uniref:Elongin-A n=1 Tax=Puccinia striiformis TaxID=27350 RepID=A0A2S4UUD6_9BASI|nr:hypothetical protein PSTT_12830 [Puccinia striiformis]
MDMLTSVYVPAPIVLTAHSGGLVEVGNCPYRLIRPVLVACQPDQLAHIEDCSPHLMLDSDEIWKIHLARDFPNEPSLPSSGPTELTSTGIDTSQEGDNHGPDDDQIREVDIPVNRLHYFKTRLAKEEALASASARLREKVQASRSDSQKRKAIFTGQTDYGIGSKKKKLTGSKSWGNYTPAGKTLAEKARQQVKKSAAVYANAVRAKATSTSSSTTSTSTPRANPRVMNGSARPTNNIPIFSIRKPLGKSPAPTCILRPQSTVQPVIKVVKKPSPSTGDPSSSSLGLTDSDNTSSTVIKPTPFPKPKPKLTPIKGPLTSDLIRRSVPPSNKPCLPLPASSSNLNRTISHSSSSTTTTKTSSLFMPKKRKPPPQLPSKSLIFSRPDNSST